MDRPNSEGTSTVEVDLSELIAFVARGLVDDGDAVEARQIDTDKTVTVELRVANQDMGKVIGKQGRIARAMRTIVKAAATPSGKLARLDIVD